MARDYIKAFYNSKMWARTRREYAQTVSGLCERCLAAGIYTPGKIVHHKIHITPENCNRPEILLDFNNLELLCQECHNREHHSIESTARYRFDELGNLIIIGE